MRPGSAIVIFHSMMLGFGPIFPFFPSCFSSWIALNGRKDRAQLLVQAGVLSSYVNIFRHNEWERVKSGEKQGDY
jgi:hypothetical protein